MATQRRVHEGHGSCRCDEPYAGHVNLEQDPVHQLTSAVAHEGVVEDAEGERDRAAHQVGDDEDSDEGVVDGEECLVVPNSQDEVEEAEHCRDA